MTLLERLKDDQRRSSKGPCRMGVLLAELGKQERDAIEEILDSIVNMEGKYSASWLAAQLRKEGYQMNHSTLLRHARKDCCCGVG